VVAASHNNFDFLFVLVLQRVIKLTSIYRIDDGAGVGQCPSSFYQAFVGLGRQPVFPFNQSELGPSHLGKVAQKPIPHRP
jgi:hypothetical protein